MSLEEFANRGMKAQAAVDTIISDHKAAEKIIKEASRRRAPRAHLRKVEEWNHRHLVGTKVRVTLDDRSQKVTVTTSEAWVLGGHSAVVLLEGISGCYDLYRVEAA